MKFKRYIFLFFVLFIPLIKANANSISNIDSQVYIDNNGRAIVTEVWNVLVDSGTEGYHPFSNLGDMNINLISVSMDDKKYDIVSNWNINGSLKDKAYKASLYENVDGYSICFGFSEFGVHSYKIVYSINNFIINLKDSQMLYFNFLTNDNIDINNVNIQVYSDNKYDSNTGVYGYGKKGSPAYLKNGRIFMSTNNQGLDSGEYMALLVKFPINTFNSNYSIDKNFDYYLKRANEGATSYSDDLLEIPWFMKLILLFIPFSIVLLILGKIFGKGHTQGRNSYKLNHINIGNDNFNDVLPYRDIPFNGDILKIFWVIYNYNLGNRDEDILGAYLLKWINDDNIELEKNGNKVSNIVFVKKPINCYELEEQLYVFFRLASITNDKLDDIGNVVYKLDKDEFSEWCLNNGYRVREWFNKILEYTTDMFVKEGKISAIVDDGVVRYDINDSFKEDIGQVFGLKKFLINFSVIDSREPLEVKLLNNYLICSSMFGISKEVFKKLKDFYPDLIADDLINTIAVDYINDLVNSNINFDNDNSSGNNGAFSDMISDAQSYGDTGVGGSGFSSGGGGNDAFGGGNSGIGFR